MNIEILVHTRPNLRNREMTVFAGQLFLKKLFDSDKDLSEVESIYLEFPERWLNILEIRMLFKIIAKRCPNMQTVKILTSNEHLLSVSDPRTIKIFSENDKYPEVEYKIGIRYCPPAEKEGLQIF